ncbi:terminase large subunit domain-containing protein [Vacuolonema iberomarrocanum]|uniref:terminase large subunit domain-containing protein n=1 Tax=Vacuolonema iberomarrocanum TaxID=3454632 RepID=UPI0019F2E62E|nr:hypothetical protein [filamentous cyanobacterium LEGE 07170]
MTDSLLLPYQQRWCADHSGFKLWSKSRRIGASWSEAGDAALLAAATKGSDVFYLAYEKEMTRQFVMDAAEWAKVYSLAASEIEESEEVFRQGDEDKAVQVFRIWFNSGHRIEALSSTPRNLRSKQGRVIIDEAAFHDDLPELLKAAKALRLWGSTIHLITTYNGLDNDYYELEQQVLAGKFPYSRHLTTFRQAVADGLYKRICLVKGWDWSKQAEAEWVDQTYEEFGDDAGEELDCVPRQGGGRYFSRVLVESCMDPQLPVLRWEQPDSFALQSDEARYQACNEWLMREVLPILDTFDPGLKSAYGSDFARSADLSVFFFGQEEANLTRRVRLAIELRNIPFRQQEQILFFCADRLPRFISAAMDARGNGQYLAEVALQRYGSRVEAVMATDTFYAETFPKYRAGMQDRKFQIPADTDLLDDHGLVELIQGIPKIPNERRSKGKDGKARHGDGAIAGLLFWRASTRPTAPIEFDLILQPATTSVDLFKQNDLRHSEQAFR